MGAVVDRLDIRFQEARQFIGLSLTFQQIDVEVLPDPPGSSVIALDLNGERIEVTTPADPTQESVVDQLVAAIGASGQQTAVNITDQGDSYRLQAVGDPFTIAVDDSQDLVPRLTAEDQLLDTLILVAKQTADEYLNNPFVEYERDDCGRILYEPCNGHAAGLGFPHSHTLHDHHQGLQRERKPLGFEQRVVKAELPIPAAVRTGVLQVLQHLWTSAQEGQQGSDPTQLQAVGPVRVRKEGDVSITYATRQEQFSGGSSGDQVAGAIGQALPAFARSLLDQYRLPANT